MLLVVLLCGIGVQAQKKKTPKTKTQKQTVVYDSLLAKKLGADEYGMKKYVLAFLKPGSTKIDDQEKLFDIRQAHLKFITNLEQTGELIVSGPFMDVQPLLGIFVFNVVSVDDAKKLTEGDPAVKEGALSYEFHPWYGSAALIENAKLHTKIAKRKVAQ